MVMYFLNHNCKPFHIIFPTSKYNSTELYMHQDNEICRTHIVWLNLYHANRAALGGFQSATPEFT